MWTRGWDVFAPDEHLVFHMWERSYRPTFWEVDGAAELKRASQRLLLLGMSCGSLAEESSKSSPGRCSRRSSAASTASPSGGGGAPSSHSSRASTPDAMGSGRGQCRV